MWGGGGASLSHNVTLFEEFTPFIYLSSQEFMGSLTRPLFTIFICFCENQLDQNQVVCIFFPVPWKKAIHIASSSKIMQWHVISKVNIWKLAPNSICRNFVWAWQSFLAWLELILLCRFWYIIGTAAEAHLCSCQWNSEQLQAWLYKIQRCPVILQDVGWHTDTCLAKKSSRRTRSLSRWMGSTWSRSSPAESFR